MTKTIPMPASTVSNSPAPSSTLNAGNIHTQGNNFLQAVQTSADPRTGQFNLAIVIPLGQANDMAGPSWSFTLAYSALASQQDSGFGLGWSLQYTQLTRQQDVWILRLSSGEQFSVDLPNSDLQPGGQLAFHDFKLQSMQVTRLESDDPNGEMTFRIVHKSGEMEFIRRHNATGDTYPVHEIRSAEGHSLHFDWLRINNVLHLVAVRDQQRTLVQYDRLLRRLTLEPGSTDQAVVQFIQGNSELAGVLLPEIDTPFTFRYDNQAVGDQWLRLPVEVSSPLGATDTVNWSKTLESSHRLPSKAPIVFMPRVVSWLHRDGPQAAALLHRYAWTGTRNYLGGGSPQEFDWQAGHDSLYRLMTRYEYSSTETQFSGDERLLLWLQSNERVNAAIPQIDADALLATSIASGAVTELTTIVRTWDRHHLPIKEVTLTGNCETTSETTYGVDYAQSWENQPPQCQLPHAIKNTYRDTQTDHAYSEETVHEYDEFGNTLRTLLPTQVEEISEYYPASGELAGCPLDASGMVRYLQRKTIYPAPGCLGNAPILYTRYEYEALPSLISGDPDHAVVCLEELGNHTTGEVLESTRQTYEHEDQAHYGRQKTAITTLNGKATSTLYEYEITRVPGETPLLWTRTLIKGFENSALATSASADARSLLTGLTHCEVSAAGARTLYTYDRLGRIVRTAIAEGTCYEAERTCSFHLDDDFIARYAPRIGNDLAVGAGIEEADATGQRKRTWLDGSSRAVLVQLEDLDNEAGVFREIATTRYDAWGREIEQVNKDWNADGECLFTLTSTTAYDDWGNVCRQTDATGVVTHTINDPIRRSVERWQESTAGKLSGKQVTTLNAAGSPLESVLFDDQGHAVRTTHYTRDGLDRVVEQRTLPRDGTPRVTQFEYDGYSRITARLEHFQEEDGQLIRVVRWQYAAHSDGDHPESVGVEIAKAVING
ncbi:hypothetical protein P0Y43_10010 [Pseudomonas entomophila]|uniref:hypothetical protein n=1 Tax=Pseudomonas entomophila TaxID=312306 RepID=UPI0023D867F8|nr:hypothetical protein [Pseudomonas entomophila]MDF0731057.1 hypothetical protein [Pseudomonas entomophila]